MFRDGKKTTEFFVTLFTAGGVFLAGLNGTIPPRYSIWLITAVAVCYAISRSIQKFGTDFERGYKSSEFLVAALSVGLAVVSAVNDNVSNKFAALSVTIIGGVIVFVRALAKPNPLTTGSNAVTADALAEFAAADQGDK